MRIKGINLRFALLMLITCNTSYTQIVNYNTKDGLVFNNVDHISEDDEGLVYISTGEGLNIFDGSEFTLFNLHNTDGFSNKVAQTIFLKKGLILIGTRDKGLFVWDKLKKMIIPLILEKEPLESQVGITTLFLDSSGQVWVGNDKGTLFSFPLSDIDSNSSDYILSEAEEITTLSGAILTILEVDQTILIGSKGSKATRIRKANNNYIIDQPIEVAGAASINSIAFAKEILFLGTDKGLFKLMGFAPHENKDVQTLTDSWKYGTPFCHRTGNKYSCFN